MERHIKIAVAGNPNAGKSTMINALAGSRLQVGNWTGVTVEKKEAIIAYEGLSFQFIDLPGTYSLSPYTEEEVVARDFLMKENPDLILNVVDATNLERNLYLTVQLLELGIPMIIALNMYDEVEKKGYQIDIPAIEKLLNVKIIPTIAIKKKGVPEIFKTISNKASDLNSFRPSILHYSKDIDRASHTIIEQISTENPEFENKGLFKWLSYKVLEEDQNVLSQFNLEFAHLANNEAVNHLKQAHDSDLESLMTDMRYAQASGLVQETVTRPIIRKQEITEKIDKFILNRYLSLPLFFGIIWVMFKLTFDIATPFVDWIDGVFSGPLTNWTSHLLTAINASPWLHSLLIEGIIGGVGFVLVFVPVISTMMFFITFLEGCGYMARAAFVMDRYMHLIGLHGKSFIPLLLGFGCNVPGVYATRTLENQKDRALTTLLIPMMTCGARLPVYILFVSVFFPNHSGEVLFSIYILGILLAVLMGILFRKFLFQDEAPQFIMELPPYRMPSFKNLLIHTWEKAKHFIIKAGTTILAMSIIVWFALNLPWGVENKKDSILGQTSQIIAPVLEPIGFGTWESSASLITGIIAKEIIISTMGEVYGNHQTIAAEPKPDIIEDFKTTVISFYHAVFKAGTNVFSTVGISSLSLEESADGQSIKGEIKNSFTPLQAYSFMVFVLLYMPCIVTGIAIKHEFGSWKLFYISVAYGLTLAWISSFIIFQGGKLLEIGG
jgi:ferrous iron transport protein B